MCLVQLIFFFIFLPAAAYLYRGSHTEKIKRMGDMGCFRKAEGKSGNQFWMKCRSLNEVSSRAEWSFRPALISYSLYSGCR